MTSNIFSRFSFSSILLKSLLQLRLQLSFSLNSIKDNPSMALYPWIVETVEKMTQNGTRGS